MLFNSAEYGAFLALVFAAYWALSSRRRTAQNVVLLLASWTFYAWWDWRFLGLIVGSSVVDYVVALRIESATSESARKRWLGASLFANLGALFTFKYFGFFAENLVALLQTMGLRASQLELEILLPVGISFYTFQTLSYTIDVYRRRRSPTRDALAFMTYVSFFPQLVAGPIERASSLLPQFLERRTFDLAAARDGLRQILWGLFKKIAVADSVALIADRTFAKPGNFTGSELVVGVVYFAIQIYADFSAYSDIAIGSARLFGIRLSRNFANPYFSRDIAEFWRRWHISLSTWFRDYVYIPLGGSRVSVRRGLRNVFVVFVVSGIWHGANWTFVAWGVLHALYFIPLYAFGTNRRHLDVVAADRWFPTVRELGQIVLTFGLTTTAWVLFRARSMGDALAYFDGIASSSLFSIPTNPAYIVPIAVLIVVEWFQRREEHALRIARLPTWLRWTTYIVLIWLTLRYRGETGAFIYFQF